MDLPYQVCEIGNVLQYLVGVDCVELIILERKAVVEIGDYVHARDSVRIQPDSIG